MPDVMGYWGGLGLGPGESDTRMPKPSTMTWSCLVGSGNRVGVVGIQGVVTKEAGCLWWALCSMAHTSGHEGPEYCGESVRACIRSTAGECEGEEAGGGSATMCRLHLPPRNAPVVQSGTTHLSPLCRVHRLLERASVVHPDIMHGLLPCCFRMPFDCDTWLRPGDGTGWWRMHLLLRVTFLAQSM